jgi:hypothetical protein
MDEIRTESKVVRDEMVTLKLDVPTEAIHILSQ